jgi:2-polyprenyl-3-methyl-5-hydroxy-6-metoxy-1,4-benzoquinol methylase
MSGSKEYFDQKAATWDDEPRRVDMAKAVAMKIREAAPMDEDTEAMEFGCGTGLISAMLADSVKSITAVDTSEQMLKVLDEKLQKNNIGNIKTRRADLTKEKPFGEKFDLIFSSMAFHHIDNIKVLLGKFNQMLRDGGRVAISDLDTEQGFHDYEVAHKGFDRNEFAAWLKDAGFGSVKEQTAYVINKPDAKGVLRDFPVFLITADKNQFAES